MGSAAERWREDLASWAIPTEILDAAPESPWTLSTELFARRADRARDRVTLSNHRAREALPQGGTVVDVGCGAGAASLPLVPPAGRVIGVDSSIDMLDAFLARASNSGAEAVTVEGTWPEAAGRTPAGDVVVCHHVFYNVPDLPAFVAGLTDHARRRVVVEMTVDHPRSSRNDLWLRFHGLHRPDRPTADDASAVLAEMGIDHGREDWESETVAGFSRMEDLVANVRRELCLTPDRDPEVLEAIRHWPVEREGVFGFPPKPLVTLWWKGSG